MPSTSKPNLLFIPVFQEYHRVNTEILLKKSFISMEVNILSTLQNDYTTRSRKTDTKAVVDTELNEAEKLETFNLSLLFLIKNFCLIISLYPSNSAGNRSLRSCKYLKIFQKFIYFILRSYIFSFYLY